MSVVTLGTSNAWLSPDKVRALGSEAGLSIPDKHVDDFSKLLGALDESVKSILDEEDYVPKPDLTKYPRTDIHVPEDTDKGGWAIKCTAKCTEPKSDLLRDRTIALKDNVALASVPCTNGTRAMEWTPEFDATIASRIMDAGGTITGKAACECACLEGVSDTSCTGIVHNPYADYYSCGGSSSGSGRLVATGNVDMAIGCDQGGSIRIPAANCGIVGHKPTWGLVPYTGIISLECTIDHAGPMTKTVRDAALLLDSISGSDGIDDRQPPFMPTPYLDYTKNLDSFVSSADASKPLTGIKVGLLEEGFTIPEMDRNVQRACTAAIDRMQHLGADITKVSVPSHHRGMLVWMCSLPIAGARQGFLSDMTGRKQLYMTERISASGAPLPQKAFDAFGPGAQNMYLRYLYVKDKYGPKLHAKCSNLIRKMSVRGLPRETLQWRLTSKNRMTTTVP